MMMIIVGFAAGMNGISCEFPVAWIAGGWCPALFLHPESPPYMPAICLMAYIYFFFFFFALDISAAIVMVFLYACVRCREEGRAAHKRKGAVWIVHASMPSIPSSQDQKGWPYRVGM
ncbi:hypothetical protein TcG_06715 [Trypanosoma cruzi]|nr:hypothetical protein TcG_06715 [Trypanosoma cruzi]